MSLNMETESDSWVALLAVDSAVYGVQGKTKRPMKRVKSYSPEVAVGWGGQDNTSQSVATSTSCRWRIRITLTRFSIMCPV